MATRKEGPVVKALNDMIEATVIVVYSGLITFGKAVTLLPAILLVSVLSIIFSGSKAAGKKLDNILTAGWNFVFSEIAGLTATSEKSTPAPQPVPEKKVEKKAKEPIQPIGTLMNVPVMPMNRGPKKQEALN